MAERVCIYCGFTDRQQWDCPEGNICVPGHSHHWRFSEGEHRGIPLTTMSLNADGEAVAPPDIPYYESKQVISGLDVGFWNNSPDDDWPEIID